MLTNTSINFSKKIVPQDFNENFSIRLDRFLRRYFRNLPQSLIEKAARKGCLFVNDQKAKVNTRLYSKDIVLYPYAFETFVQPDNGKIKDPFLFAQFQKMIVYENDELCIINKPYDIAAQGGVNVKYSIDDMANAGKDPYFLVHRLDKQTTGLLILAKNAVTANVLMHQFREKKIQKYYVAFVHFKPSSISGMINLPLKEGLNQKMEINFSQGKESKTRYRLVKKVGDYYCLVLKPYTGRKHQIRIHLSKGLQTPIVGDLKYGGIIGERMFLHAYKIVLPVGKDKITVRV